MFSSNDLSTVKVLISKDQLIKATEVLTEFAREYFLPISHDVIIFSRDLYNLKRGVTKGVISFETEYVERRKISFRMLQLLDTIEDHIL